MVLILDMVNSLITRQSLKLRPSRASLIYCQA
jgi:hypothetical protein